MEQLSESKTEKIASSLLPREQYAEAIKKFDRGLIKMEIENDRQCLFYFGANHSRDPSNEQYPALKEYWNEFLNKTEDRDRVVLVESVLRIVGTNEEQTIKEGSEGNLITIWATRENIPIACPEPDPVKTLKEVLTRFSREEAAYYEFAVAKSAWFRLPEPREKRWSFENYMARFFGLVKKEPGWEDFDWSLDNMKRIHRDLFNEDLKEQERYPTDILNPNIDDTQINRLARFRSDIRDIHIVSEVERYWKEGKSILVVFGRGHLIIQEPALRELLK